MKKEIGPEILRMEPGEYAKGSGLTIEYGFTLGPYGEALVASTPKGVCYLGFADKRKVVTEELAKNFSNAKFKKMAEVTGWKKISKNKFHIKGTDFQMKVWQALLAIPFGRRTTYAKLAKAIKKPNALRAVGTAVGNNPVSFFIPCHRVVPTSGGIGKYHWGSERKEQMLEAEGQRSPLL